MSQLPPSRKQPGFTLTEMAVVMVIVALLIGGMMIPLGTQQDLRQRQDADKALANIREALMGYALINGRLPCPADTTIATEVANAGVEATTGSGAALTCACTSAASGIAQASGGTACTATSIAGVLPWATLGLTETDPWGNRHTYRVNGTFSRGVNSTPTLLSTFGTGCALTQVGDMPTKSAFALCTQGDIVVRNTTGGTVLLGGIPAIVVSHGKNAAGAWSTLGTQVAGAAGDELENANGDDTFVGSVNIDDMIMTISTNILMSRMLTAGKLP